MGKLPPEFERKLSGGELPLQDVSVAIQNALEVCDDYTKSQPLVIPKKA